MENDIYGSMLIISFSGIVSNSAQGAKDRQIIPKGWFDGLYLWLRGMIESTLTQRQRVSGFGLPPSRRAEGISDKEGSPESPCAGFNGIISSIFQSQANFNQPFLTSTRLMPVNIRILLHTQLQLFMFWVNICKTLKRGVDFRFTRPLKWCIIHP